MPLPGLGYATALQSPFDFYALALCKLLQRVLHKLRQKSLEID
jgi:hypothetical protein